MSFGAKPETGAARDCGTEEDGVEDMLTVKYLQADGVETIGEYDGVTKEVQDGHPIIYAHRADGGENCAQFGPILTGSSEDACIPTLYVMNRFGATVATYRL